jgi:hypothetical protein
MTEVTHYSEELADLRVHFFAVCVNPSETGTIRAAGRALAFPVRVFSRIPETTTGQRKASHKSLLSNCRFRP